MVLGVGWGFLSAKAGWSRWLAHLLGAMFAALLVPMIVGERLVKGGGPVEWFQATAAACVDAWFDLTSVELPFTIEIGHFLLVLGPDHVGDRPVRRICHVPSPTAAQRGDPHRARAGGQHVADPARPAAYLIMYSLAALFLLIRFHAFDERTLWMRHRIGDAAALGGLYLRGGTVFVASAIVVADPDATAASASRWPRCGGAPTRS